MKIFVIAVALMGMAGLAYSEETLGEKAEAVTNDATRSVKKGVNRTQEAVCMKDDVECLSEKAKHRAEEGTDYSKDKVKELKNDIDSDKK
jgi:anti-sigma28 factor (negative regulator of flagellin synthesis)